MSERAGEPGAEPGRLSPVTAGLGVAGVAAGFGGVGMLEAGSTIGIEVGVLMLVAALALVAVGIGGRPHGPDVEGPLDLSARLGLGLLGGALAGLVHGVATEAAGAAGLAALLGVGVDVELTAAQYLFRSLYGSAWGLVFGTLYPLVPGDGYSSKGLTFSLLPSLYTLLVVYPVFLGLGLLGVRQGFLTFAFVLLGNAIAGWVAAWVIAWGAHTDLAPVARPLAD